MGAELFDSVEKYRTMEAEVDAILGYSLRHLCLDDPDDLLRQTQYTQPALYVVNALYYYSISETMRPDFVAGHSLGEYNALLAAGAFDFLTGLRLVQRRGELMARVKNGSMAAVIGIGPLEVMRVLRDLSFTDLDIANYNSPLQTIISGPADKISEVRSAFEEAGADPFINLPVSAAFHSRYMEGAAQEFAASLDRVSLSAPDLPVVANLSALPYPSRDAEHAIRTSLVKQITQPVLWSQTVRYLLDRGVDRFAEVGPGQVLTNLVRQTRELIGL